MAFRMKNSTNIVRQLKSKTGLLSLVSQSSCSSVVNDCSMISLSSSFAQYLKFPNSNLYFSPTLFQSHRLESIKAGKQLDSPCNSVNSQFLDFPGGKVTFTPEMRFIAESSNERIPCYRVLHDNGQPILGSSFIQVSEEVSVKLYSDMVRLQIMDTVFYEAQRQGRISFYVTSSGEEAINVASAAALKKMMISSFLSTGSQEFSYGVVSLHKNLQTNVFETKLIMVKAGRCLSIMVLTSTTTLLYHQQ